MLSTEGWNGLDFNSVGGYEQRTHLMFVSVYAAGSATIFSHRLSEVRDKDRIKERIGFCPQFNLQFEALTVKENLWVFAGIKGILSSETEREVSASSLEKSLDCTAALENVPLKI